MLSWRTAEVLAIFRSKEVCDTRVDVHATRIATFCQVTGHVQEEAMWAWYPHVTTIVH